MSKRQTFTKIIAGNTQSGFAKRSKRAGKTNLPLREPEDSCMKAVKSIMRDPGVRSYTDQKELCGHKALCLWAVRIDFERGVSVHNDAGYILEGKGLM